MVGSENINKVVIIGIKKIYNFRLKLKFDVQLIITLKKLETKVLENYHYFYLNMHYKENKK